MSNFTRHQYVAKAAKKAGISTSQALDMIAYDHAMENLYPKNKLKKINVNFAGDTLKEINKIAKALRISTDAVIAVALIDYMEQAGT
jgi:hypothetical protein